MIHRPRGIDRVVTVAYADAVMQNVHAVAMMMSIMTASPRQDVSRM